IGVMNRVETLAERAHGSRPERVFPFRNLVPLPEIVSEIHAVGPKSKEVTRRLDRLAAELGPELIVLEEMPLEDIARAGSSTLGEAIRRLRAGDVRREAGYDGEYGVISLFSPDELRGRAAVASLFGPEEPEAGARQRAMSEPAGREPCRGSGMGGGGAPSPRASEGVEGGGSLGSQRGELPRETCRGGGEGGGGGAPPPGWRARRLGGQHH